MKLELKTLSQSLHEGLLSMRLNVDESAEEKLIKYIELLHQWNTIHNLTAVRDPLEMISRHLLDSFTVQTYLFGENGHPVQRVLDVGTGAGLPGIPLAIQNKDIEFVLLDSNTKKMTFLTHIITSLKIENVNLVCSRIESYQDEKGFDRIVSRAFSSLEKFVILSGPLLRKEGKLIAMKGLPDKSELEAVPEPYTIEGIQPVQVPGVLGERRLIVIHKNVEAGSCVGREG